MSRMPLCAAACLCLPLTVAHAQMPLTAAIVSPAPDTVLNSPATSVTLRFPSGAKVTLAVNGVRADPSQIGRTETDSAAHLVTQTWYGVILQEGANTLTLTDADGAKTTRTVQVETTVKGLTLRTNGSHLPADGRATLTVEGTLLDGRGSVLRREALVTLTASAGEWAGTDADLDAPGFQVAAQAGRFTATLRAGVQARHVTLRAACREQEAFAKIEFTTDLRPGLATGVVDLRFGSRRADYDRPIQDFVSPDVSDSKTLHGRTSVFATGKVGDYLFLGTYNSDHALNQTAQGPSSLGRDTQTADQQYPVYGDSSTAYALAQSRDHLALRLEKNSDYLLWGDYGTAEFSGRSQQLTAITRSFHAFKTNYQFGALQATGFYGDHVQGFQRDTISPDGTSGFYFLSHRPLVYGSENIFLELEDLYRPGTVLSRTAASRGADYEIDYDRGTVLFHQPLLRTETGPNGETLVRRIVVTYQYETGGSGAGVYGGRLAYHLPGAAGPQANLLGVTFVRQNQGLRQFSLYGADTALPLGSLGSVIAEFGHSSNSSELLGRVSGSAYRVTAEAALPGGTSASAYYRSADTGFANDATTSFVPGQRRYGGELTTRLGADTRLRVGADHEDNHGLAPQPADTLAGLVDPGNAPAAGTPVDNSLQTLSVAVDQRIQKATVSVGVTSRSRTDRLAADNTSLSGHSAQAETRLSVPAGKDVTLTAENTTSLTKSTDAVYTDHTAVGVTWKARPGVQVRATQQFFGRGQYSGHTLTTVETLAERKSADGTQMSDRMTLTGGASGVALQQSLGLGKRWTVAKGVAVDASYQHVSGGFLGKTGAGPRSAQPYAAGQSASSLGVSGGGSFSVGAEYTRPATFKASARYEARDSAGGSNTVVTGALAGKLAGPLTALASYQAASSSNPLLEGLGQASTLRIGLAYRDPLRDTVNLLVHYDFRRNPSVIPDALLLGSGVGSREQIFAAEGIYAPQWQWEFYGKLARRDSASFLAGDYTGRSRIDLAQARATYRFRSNLELVGDARWIGQPSAGYSSRGFVLETGFYATPDLRLGVGYSFGRVGDRDFSGPRSSGGFFLGMTAKVNQLFGGFGLEKNALADTGQPVPKNFQPGPLGNAAGPTRPLTTGGDEKTR